MPKKLVLDVPNELWEKVTAYKEKNQLHNKNAAVNALLLKALEGLDGQ